MKSIFKKLIAKLKSAFSRPKIQEFDDRLDRGADIFLDKYAEVLHDLAKT